MREENPANINKDYRKEHTQEETCGGSALPHIVFTKSYAAHNSEEDIHVFSFSENFYFYDWNRGEHAGQHLFRII